MPFGQHKGKWVQGYHHYSTLRKKHPALIQKPGAVVMVHRDLNKDGKRTGDALAPAWGINQHGTSPTAKPGVVGNYSEGCLVGLDWTQHLEFIERTRSDLRFIVNPGFAYS